MSFTYKAPLFPCLHRCKWCGKRLTNEHKDEIVCETSLCFDDIFEEFYCSKKCAKAHQNWLDGREKRNDSLNNYIKK